MKTHKEVYPSYASRKLLDLTCNTLKELAHKEFEFYKNVKEIYEEVYEPVFTAIHDKNEIKLRVNELYQEKKRLESEERAILGTINHLNSLKEESVERLMSDPVFTSVASIIQYKQSHEEWSTRS